MKQVDGESIAESLDDFRYAWTQSFSTDEALSRNSISNSGRELTHDLVDRAAH